MFKKYKVSLFMDNTYQVLKLIDDFEYKKVFQGNLSDCEAYIRLKEGGYY